MTCDSSQSNSSNADTARTPTAVGGDPQPLCLTLWLPRYLGPSLNTMLRLHFGQQAKLKKAAALALRCALQAAAQDSLIQTTMSHLANTFWTNYVTTASSQKTTRKHASSSPARKGQNAR